MNECRPLFRKRKTVEKIEQSFLIIRLVKRFVKQIVRAVCAKRLSLYRYGVAAVVRKREYIVLSETESLPDFKGDSDSASFTEDFKRLIHF